MAVISELYTYTDAELSEMFDSLEDAGYDIMNHEKMRAISNEMKHRAGL